MNHIRNPRPRSAFIELLLLEWRRHMGTLLIAPAIILLVFVYSIVRFGTPANDLDAALLFLLMVLPLFSLPLLAISWGFSAIGDEWRGHTHQLLLSLPVSGRTLLGAKFAAAGVGLSALSLFGAGLAWWRLVRRGVLQGLGLSTTQRLMIEAVAPVSQFGLVLLGLVSALLLLFAAGMLASVVGRSVRRFGGWVAGASFIGLLFIWSLLPIAMARWVPSMACVRGQTAGSCPFTPADLISDVLFIGLMWWVATTLWDRKVEV